MASGCALIATDVGASSELVINEVNGLLIKKVVLKNYTTQ